VYSVLETIAREESGRLDLLVNNAFQIAALDSMTGKPFWEQGAAVWDPLMQVGLRSHYVAACAAAPLLIETAQAKRPPVAPAILNVGSFGGASYVFNVAYGVGKAGVDRLSKDMAIELRPHGVASLSLWPGVVMTERMASIKAQDEERWRTAMGVGEGYVESPRFAGRAVVALLSPSPARVDLMGRSGSVQIVAELARELGFRDVSGAQPPSIRSLQFLLPNYALKSAFSAAPSLAKFVPDWRLPLSVMGQRPDS
jgi:dehydrogenase/reductase SDR family member 1